jgi:hypothetical protein
MNPFLSSEVAGEHIRDLRENAARAGSSRREKRSEQDDRRADVSIRGFSERDIEAIRYLAALDGKLLPTGGVLVAEQAGQLVAALPVDGGDALADPFKPTADIVALLRLRARQLREASGGRRSPFAVWSRLRPPARRLA